MAIIAGLSDNNLSYNLYIYVILASAFALPAHDSLLIPVIFHAYLPQLSGSRDNTMPAKIFSKILPVLTQLIGLP